MFSKSKNCFYLTDIFWLSCMSNNAFHKRHVLEEIYCTFQLVSAHYSRHWNAINKLGMDGYGE